MLLSIDARGAIPRSVGVRFGGELFTCHQFLPKKKEKRGKMTGREIVQMALMSLKEKP
jgi:hypothetical protein